MMDETGAIKEDIEPAMLHHQGIYRRLIGDIEHRRVDIVHVGQLAQFRRIDVRCEHTRAIGRKFTCCGRTNALGGGRNQRPFTVQSIFCHDNERTRAAVSCQDTLHCDQ